MKRETIILNKPRLYAMMERRNVDLLVLRSNENSKYISEFFHNGGNLGYRPFVVFFFRDPGRKPALIVPAVDLHLAMYMSWIEDVRAYQMAELFTDLDVNFYPDFFDAARSVMSDRNAKGMVIGTEGEELSTGFRNKLEKELLADHKVVDVSYDMELVRMVKTPEENRRLKKAAEITVKAHASFREAIKVGNTDRDLFTAAVKRMYDEGADNVRFINVGCGPVSFSAHCPYPIDYALKEGDFVKVDMGAEVKGYPADFVRSYYLGYASQRAQDIWKWLNEAQMETAYWLKPGVTGGEIFDYSYKKISKHLEKYPREFFGHGLGIGSHEQPRMNKGNKTVLEPDTPVCLETSYYHEGVRFHSEETLLVTNDGIEHWTANLPRDLVVKT
jgi:Xaa-Pro aminopeptidase